MADTPNAAADTPEGRAYRALLIGLFGAVTVLETPADLDGLLEDYTIILTRPVGMSGDTPELLCRAPGGWYSFWRNREGKIEIIDEWTPTLPALLLVGGVEEDMIGTAPTRAARHAARATDPQSSHQAVRNRRMGWDTMNMRALRTFHANRGEEFGVSYYEVEQLASQQWGGGALGKSPWKRCSELHTDFDPPLIERVVDEHGGEVSVAGEFGDPVDSFRITAAGADLVRQTGPTA